ncbi:MAG: class I SAM-dependent methyltransferase [Patescibacteria group bacterium]
MGKDIAHPEVREHSLKELVSKQAHEYSARERRILQLNYPEIKNVPLEELANELSVGGRQLSVYELVLLHENFPKKSLQEVLNFLTDEESIIEYIHDMVNATKDAKQKFWQLFAVLPLSEKIQRHIFSVMTEKSQIIPEIVQASQPDNEEAIIQWTPSKVMLPIAELPHVETYVASAVDRSYFEIPRATIRMIYTDQDGKKTETSLSLSHEETAAALSFCRRRIKYIQHQRHRLFGAYRRERRLSQSDQVSYQELKIHYFKKYTEKWLKRFLAENNFDQQKLLTDESNIELELRFSQNKKGLSQKVGNLVRSPEELIAYFESKVQEKDASKVNEPTMIPLSSFDEVLDPQAFSWTRLADQAEDTSFNQSRHHQRSTEHQYNELQRAHLEIANATKSGDWSRAVDIYISYLEYWPQYIEHRLGVMDIYNRYQAGEIATMPERIASIASGPHEELRAQAAISKKLGYKMPEIVSVDNEPRMLEASRAQLPEELRGEGTDVIADMRDIPAMGSFDIVECSSFDNLKSDSEVVAMLVQMIAMVKQGGLLRFMVQPPFSEQLCSILEQHGVHILEKNSVLQFNDELRKQIHSDMGTEALKRLEYKTKRHVYFLARVDREVDQKLLLTALQSASVYADTQRNNTPTVENNIREEAEDLTINQMVALNPIFFMEKKGLTQKHVGYALTSIKGKIDASIARQLYAVYFGDARLTSFTELVFDIVKEESLLKGIFSINLLTHNHMGVREAFEEYLLNNLSYYIPILLDSDIDSSLKEKILQTAIFTDTELKALSDYFTEKMNADTDELHLESIIRLLPDNLRFHVPILMRYSAALAQYYFHFSLESVKPEVLSKNEKLQILQLPFLSIIKNEKLFSDYIEASLSLHDEQSLQLLLVSLNNLDEKKISSLSNTHQEQLQSLLSTFRSLPLNPLQISDLEKKISGQHLVQDRNIDRMNETLETQLSILFEECINLTGSASQRRPEVQEEVNKLIGSLSPEHGYDRLQVLVAIERVLDQSAVIEQFLNHPEGIKNREQIIEMIMNYVSKLLVQELTVYIYDWAEDEVVDFILSQYPTYKTHIERVMESRPNLINNEKILLALNLDITSHEVTKIDTNLRDYLFEFARKNFKLIDNLLYKNYFEIHTIYFPVTSKKLLYEFDYEFDDSQWIDGSSVLQAFKNKIKKTPEIWYFKDIYRMVGKSLILTTKPILNDFLKEVPEEHKKIIFSYYIEQMLPRYQENWTEKMPDLFFSNLNEEIEFLASHGLGILPISTKAKRKRIEVIGVGYEVLIQMFDGIENRIIGTVFVPAKEELVKKPTGVRLIANKNYYQVLGEFAFD